MTITAEILSIGDELVHGALLDTNARWLARVLEEHGAAVARMTVVGDEPAPLQAAMADACARADLVVATGGIGPTLDDRTREVAAAIAGGPLWFDAESWRAIEEYMHARRRPVPASNRTQAMFPPGATVLPNPVGTAPGFRVRLRRAELFALPGVPREMQRMTADQVLPWLAAQSGRQPVAHHCLFVLGPSEALLGERIAAFMHAGREPAVGITASAGLLTIRIVGRAGSAAAATAACEATAAELRPLLDDWCFAEGSGPLHELVGRRLLAAGTTVAFAESCTGGLAAAQLTDLPGISAVFRGGVVAYADAAKTELLGVDPDLIRQHGAVSEPVAAAMALGAARRLQAELAVATTGIAGPGGGSADKPVGTVCFGIARGAASRAYTLRIADLGRAFVRDRAVMEVFAAILRTLAGDGLAR
jgi:nicotinamide-nucleotide amidase